MIEIIALLLGLYILYSLFKYRINRIGLFWLIGILLLINGSIIVLRVPLFMPIVRWSVLCFLFVNLFFNYDRFVSLFRSFPLRNVILFCIVASLAIGVFDFRLSVFEKFYSPFREITETYFILFLGFVGIFKPNDLIRFRKPLLLILLAITIYGVYNYLSQSNPYYEFVVSHFFKGGDKDLNSKISILNFDGFRYRASSTFNMSFNYGYASSLLAVFFLHALSCAQHFKSWYFVGIICGLIGSFICSSRTVMLAVLMALAVYILLYYNLTVKIRVITIAFLVSLTAYLIIPAVTENIDNTLGVFSGNDQLGGSTVSMRERQLLGAVSYFMQSPILGNGYEYINRELGWADRDNAVLDDDMKGFESIIYQIMIEKGLIGLVSYLFLNLSLLYYFMTKLGVDRGLSSLGISIVVLFLVFSIGTGPLGSWPITMLFLGAIIKVIQIRQNAIKKEKVLIAHRRQEKIYDQV